MLAIILAILKGIAWLLLGIILVLFFLIALILASPFKYDVIGKQIGDTMEQVEGEFDVSWIFGAIHVWGSYQEEKPDVHIKLFGIPILEKKKKKKKGKKGKKRKQGGQKPPQKRKPPEGETQKEKPKPPKKKEEPPKKEPDVVYEKIEKKAPKRVKVSEVEEVKPKKTKEELLAEKLVKRAEQKAEKEATKEKRAGQLEQILTYWTLFQSIDDKKKIFLAAKKLLVRLIKGVVPKDIYIKGTVGLGEPELTGYVLALAGVLVGKFGNHIAIKGDFTQFVMEDIRLQICGRIVFGKLVYALLAFALTKPVWKMIWKIRKGLVKEHE